MGVKRQPEEEDDAAKSGTGTGPKRQRVSRACDQCRAAREKCDGIQPLCFPCASQNRDCSWQEPKRKRGVQTGYIRTLELALGWIFDKLPGSEDALYSLLTHEGGQGRSLLVGKESGAGSRLHRRWTKSTVHQEIDRLLSGADGTDTKIGKPTSPEDESESCDEAETSHVTVPHATPLAPDSEKTQVARLGSQQSFATDDRFRPPDTNRLKLPSNCWRLLDIYSSYTHCWFPVLEKALVQKTAWLYPTEGLQITCDHPDSAAHAELWASLALASFQDEASSGSENSPRLDDALVSAEKLYQIARRLIPPEDGWFAPRHVNALLILTLINIARDNLDAAWIMVGVAVRVCLGLGLERLAPGQGNWRLRHTYMGCFMLDTIISARLNHQSHLRADDLQATCFAGEDDQDEWASWVPYASSGIQGNGTTQSRTPTHSISSFRSLCAIHQVHSQIATSDMADAPSSNGEPFVTQIQRAFDHSVVHRPFHAFVTGGGVPPSHLPSIFILRLSYLCAESQAFPKSSSSARDILQCLDDYIAIHGICWAPPLFTIYMSYAAQHVDLDIITSDERRRWMKIEDSLKTVWPPRKVGIMSNFSHAMEEDSASLRHVLDPSNKILIPKAPQQLPTPSYLTEGPSDQPSFLNDLYQPTSSIPSLSSYANVNTSNARLAIDTLSTAPQAAAFDPLDVAGMPPPTEFSASSFQSTAFDYDAILDDIAAIDQSTRMESDPQFMANLGFAPGSNLADVLTHDFMGFS